MPRGLKEKDPHILRPFGHGEWGPLKTFLRILPQMPSLGRIRTGKRYGALPLERSPQPRKNEGTGYSKNPQKDWIEVARCMPIAIGKCSITSDHVELTPLMDSILLGRTPITQSNLYNYHGHPKQARKILR